MAQFQGTGTINGEGDYGFLISIVDGQLDGGDGVDKFRIHIWDKNGQNNTVYNSEPGALDGEPPSAPIQGGSIVIHQ